MTGMENSTVSITIQVLDAGSGAAIQNVETRLAGLGTAGLSAGNSLSGMSDKLKSMSSEAAAAGGALAGIGTIGAGGLDQLNTGLEGVKGNIREVGGLGREMGLHLSYSMKHAIADNEALMSGLRSLTGMFVALGVISIGEQVIEGAVHLYEKWLDVDKAVDDYNQKAQEAAQQKLFDTASLETTALLLDHIGQKVKDLQHQRESAAVYDVTGVENITGPSGEAPFTPAKDKEQAQNLTNADTLSQKKITLNDQETQHQLENQKRHDETVLTGITKAAQVQRDEDEITFQRYQTLRQNMAATAKRAAPALGMTEAEVTGLLKNQYNQQEQDEYNRNYQQGADQRVVIGRQEAEKEQQQREQVTQKLKALDEEATLSQLTGIAAVEEKQRQSVENTIAEFQKLGATVPQTQQAALDAWTKGQAEIQKEIDKTAEEEAKANQQKIESAQRFTEQIAMIGQRSDVGGTSGYARIEAETQNMLARVKNDFDKYSATLNLIDPVDEQRMLDAEQDMTAASNRILENAQRQRAELTRKTDEQITQTEAQAARLTLPPWEQAQQKIADDYQQRLQKINADVAQHVITEQQGSREVTAAWQLANAEMQKQAQQTRDQVAGQLEQLFADPAKYMEHRAKQMMFDILANWTMQLMQYNDTAKNLLGWLFGMGGHTMSTSTSPAQALGSVFGIGTAGTRGPMSESLGMPAGLNTSALSTAGTTLSTAGTTLNTAGNTLSSSGTMLTTSANQLDTAATALNSAANALQSSGSTGSGGGGGGGGGGFLSDLSSVFGGGGGGGGFQPSDLNAAPTGAGGVLGTALGSEMATMTPSLGGPLGAGDVSSGAGETLGTPGGDSSGSGLSMAKGLGIAGAGIAGGFALSKEWAAGQTGAAVLTGAMTGASIGMMAGGPIGAAVGGVVGAVVGFIGGLFSDHGLGKAKNYDKTTVQPALSNEMAAYDSGNTSYDQVATDLANLQSQAQTQTKSFGSAAVTYFNNTIVPEIQAVQLQVNKLELGNRPEKVVFSAAQYHSGGMIGGFGDLSTSDTEGFIHAMRGEHVMTPSAAATNRPWLDAMNKGANLSAMLRGSPGAMGGGPSGAGMSITISALDAKSVDYWLRNGGAQKIQAAINVNAGRYAGVSLDTT